jgi:hypothetical protein
LLNISKNYIRYQLVTQNLFDSLPSLSIDLLKYRLFTFSASPIYFSWRPASPDPGDDFVIDCAMNAGSIVVTSNVRDFRSAKDSLGLQVMTPVEFVKILASGEII